MKEATTQTGDADGTEQATRAFASTPFTFAPPAFQPYVPAAQATAPPPAQSGPSTSAQFVTKEEFYEKLSLKNPKNAGTIQPYRSPYPPYHETVPYQPGYQIPPFSMFDGGPKRHLSHFITDCRDTATKWVFAIETISPFPRRSCLRVV